MNKLDQAWQAVNTFYTKDEPQAVALLLAEIAFSEAQGAQIAQIASGLVEQVRAQAKDRGGAEALLHEFDLSSDEGVVLMCLAEALLRIPDATTADRLIRDKLSLADWQSHVGHSHSLFVNASSFGLMLSGRLVSWGADEAEGLFSRLLARLGEPVVRAGIRRAVRILGHQFVMGRNLDEALARSAEAEHRPYRHSYDMLGEAALTAQTADDYFAAYQSAIAGLASAVGDDPRPLLERPSISVKLSALHPRYEFAQWPRLEQELLPRLIALAEAARAGGIALTLDAEEAERLEISLQLFAAVFRAPQLVGWPGLGLAVQAYQKRAPAVIAWLAELASAQQKQIPVRLVKGAYWDSEVKRAQERGWPDYPVFTRKHHTDVSYLVCAQRLLASDWFYPQFATHNAHTVAAILTLGRGKSFEFQRLHGMGEALYHAVLDQHPAACRVYAPVGSYEDLLPYLVRRLLENGANTSFVNRIEQAEIPIARLIEDPVAKTRQSSVRRHRRIPLPVDLFGGERPNSRGLVFSDRQASAQLDAALAHWQGRQWQAAPLVNGERLDGAAGPLFSPADATRQIGAVTQASPAQLRQAIECASAQREHWRAAPVAERAAPLRRAAALFEQHRDELIGLIVFEGGRTLPDAVAELREAVDFLYYYAAQAERLLGAEQALPGPTGESNRLRLLARGVFACISPWNFPLAIFTGQVAAALVCGNPVLAKPASLTPLTAMRCVELLHAAGVPGEVLHFLPAAGRAVSEAWLADGRLAGVAFTGAHDTALSIQRTLAARDGAIATLIAETGGQNCMIADSSALPEQVVNDALVSAFNSAGQRCSALRVLFVQEEVAPRIKSLLSGAMEQLQIGHPAQLATDVGPVIDAAARDKLVAHSQKMAHTGKTIYQAGLPAGLPPGHYFAPCAFEVSGLDALQGEVFGPILHLIPYQATALGKVIAAINASAYGLTLGVHSRVDSTIREITQRVRAGNVYVNRTMIGAVVGVQPFGGEGLSGTGPKAGGPHTLLRYCTEQTISVNTTAVGGNASLLALDEGE